MTVNIITDLGRFKTVYGCSEDETQFPQVGAKMSSFKYIFLLLLLLLHASWQTASAARILAFLPMPWRSHQNVFRPLMKGLALKGHHVDFYTPLPMKDPPKTLNQFAVKDWHNEVVEALGRRDSLKMGYFERLSRTADLGIWVMDKLFTEDPACVDLLTSNKTYDAVITEFPVYTESTVYLGHKFKGLGISILGFFDSPWMNEMAGLPDNPAYMMSYANALPDNTDFGQRLYNFYTTASIVLSSAYLTITKHQSWADEKLRYEGWESRPKIMEMISETALYLVNSHVSSGRPYPKAPHVKEILGMHVDPQPLPKELQEFMDDAPNGVVYFSLGSILNPAKLLANGKFEIVLKVFKSLKRKVMWKIADGLPPINDPRIKVQKWFPQQGILYHKNIKLFITHGGLQSTVEAISAGVPCLGMPLIFDQEKDVAFMVQAGMALKLSFANITEANLRWSLNEILTKPKYLEKAKKQQELFHDRPRKPVDEGVYWIEYVLKHGNILRPASAKMPFYQLYLLDVVAFLVACAILAVWILRKIIGTLLCLVTCSTKTEMPQKKKTN